MIIYLARHGQTTGDIEDRFGGDYDDHLTGEGKQQATGLAGQLADKSVEKLFSSPMIRAQETAGIVGDKLGLDVATVSEFRERNSYGILTGLTKSEAKEKYPDLVELAKDFHNTVEGAEDYEVFKNRIIYALKEQSKVESEKIAVITHGGPIKVIYREVLGLGEINVSDCGYAVLECNKGNFKLIEAVGITKI